MRQSYETLFRCPTCGNMGALYLAKVDGAQLIIKQRCSQHGGRDFRLPLKELDSYKDLIRDGIYRCYSCGGPALPGPVKYSGAYAIINCVCQTNHTSQKTQKIWSTIYLDIIKEQKEGLEPAMQPIKEKVPEVPKPEPISREPEIEPQHQPVPERLSVCPSCGTDLEGNEKFCGICGSKLTD